MTPRDPCHAYVPRLRVVLASGHRPRDAPPPMSQALRQAILEIAAAAEPQGETMGAIVDALVGEGFTATIVETEVWQLMAQRRLTPNGFVCRRVRRRDSMDEMEIKRSYEFLLIPWSHDADHQLELALASESDGVPEAVDDEHR